MESPTDPPGRTAASSSGGGNAGQVELPTSSSTLPPQPPQPPAQPLSRYESQKRRDWNTFLQYLRNHKPPLTLQRCSGAHVIEFLKYLDQFGKTKVHADTCPHFGKPNPPLPCACPLKQAWGSLDALIGRLRAAYEESGGRPESNPFAARAVRIYLREVRESQAKARGIPYEKKKRKRGAPPASSVSGSASASASAPPETSREREAEAEEEEKPSSSAVDSTIIAAATTTTASTVVSSAAASATNTITTSVGTVGTTGTRSGGTRSASVGASSSSKDAKKKSRLKEAS